MSTPTRATADVPPPIRLLSDLDPNDPVTDVCRAVIRHQLERRVGPITLLPSGRDDGRRDTIELDGGPLFGCGTHLAALFHEQVDEMAVDIRRRMRVHLDSGTDRIPPTPLDTYVTVLDDADLAQTHAGLRALRDGASMPTDDLHTEFDRLADIIGQADPAAATVQSQQLAIDGLSAELAEERREVIRLSAAVERLGDTIDVLTGRQTDTDLRRSLADPS